VDPSEQLPKLRTRVRFPSLALLKALVRRGMGFSGERCFIANPGRAGKPAVWRALTQAFCKVARRRPSLSGPVKTRDPLSLGGKALRCQARASVTSNGR
jgi:hypothetical protein